MLIEIDSKMFLMSYISIVTFTRLIKESKLRNKTHRYFEKYVYYEYGKIRQQFS